MNATALRRVLVTLAAYALTMAVIAEARTFSDETTFLGAVVNPTTVSFDIFSVGFLPQTTLELGDVTVVLTNSGSAPIFPPGFGGFTTNFLSTSAQDGGNNVVISFPAGTAAAGFKIVSVFPVTLTATYVASGAETIEFSALHVTFLGFAGGSELQSIRISSPFTPELTPIVNIGNITYASALATVAVPTLSEVTLLALAASFLLIAWRALRRTVPT